MFSITLRSFELGLISFAIDDKRIRVNEIAKNILNINFIYRDKCEV